jgi:hypothetical protein
MTAAFKSALTLRRRSGWEAADMGILLWRQNWPALFLFFGIPSGLFSLALFCIPGDEEIMAYIMGAVLWWPKPFFDRFALYIAAARFFEPEARMGRLFKGLGKSLIRGLAGDLLWRRFSPCRSSRMPLRVLEGLKGKALQRRLNVMNDRGLHFGFPLTVIFLALGGALAYGELAFIYGIFELLQPGYLGGFWDNWEVFSKASLALSWFNGLFVETLFVCAGFGVYINTRVETEGWDIELLFRQYAEKWRAETAGTGIPDCRKQSAF